MKKIIALLLLVLSSVLVLTSCSGKSLKQVVGSYVNAVSYKEKAFYEAVFPEDKNAKIDVEKISKAFDMFESEYALINSYFGGAKFVDEEGKAYDNYYRNTYDPLVGTYLSEAVSFVDKIKAGEDVVPLLDVLWDYDVRFIESHNGFLDLLEKY